MSEPQKHGVPDWFLNRQKDRVDGTTSHLISNDIGARLRQDLERLKKIRHHRGLRHYWGLRVRGQHTCSTGRKKAKAPGGTKERAENELRFFFSTFFFRRQEVNAENKREMNVEQKESKQVVFQRGKIFLFVAIFVFFIF